MTYRPGDTAALDMQVSGQDGAGVQAALGLAIVDEAVFALAEQDPGFARLYFLLEQEILHPEYDLHGFSVPDLVAGACRQATRLLRGAVDGAAQASLADARCAPAVELQPEGQFARGCPAARLRAAGPVLQGLHATGPASPLLAAGRWAWLLWWRCRCWREKRSGAAC